MKKFTFWKDYTKEQAFAITVGDIIDNDVVCSVKQYKDHLIINTMSCSNKQKTYVLCQNLVNLYTYIVLDE